MLWLRALRWYWAQLRRSTEGIDGTFDLVPKLPWFFNCSCFFASHSCSDHRRCWPTHFHAISGVKWWPGVQTYQTRFFESCGVDRLTGLQGRPQLLQPALTLGSLLFRILKAPRHVGTGQRSRPWSTLPAPVVDKPLWNQDDVNLSFEACL